MPALVGSNTLNFMLPSAPASCNGFWGEPDACSLRRSSGATSPPRRDPWWKTSRDGRRDGENSVWTRSRGRRIAWEADRRPKPCWRFRPRGLPAAHRSPMTSTLRPGSGISLFVKDSHSPGSIGSWPVKTGN